MALCTGLALFPGTALVQFGAPTSLTADNVEVALGWTNPNHSTITKYQVIDDGGATFTDIGGSDASTTSHTVTGFTNRTQYTLAVQAVDNSDGFAFTDTGDTLDHLKIPSLPEDDSGSETRTLSLNGTDITDSALPKW